MTSRYVSSTVVTVPTPTTIDVISESDIVKSSLVFSQAPGEWPVHQTSVTYHSAPVGGSRRFGFSRGARRLENFLGQRGVIIVEVMAARQADLVRLACRERGTQAVVFFLTVDAQQRQAQTADFGQHGRSAVVAAAQPVAQMDFERVVRHYLASWHTRRV